jgi:hypothetical protein
MKFLAREKSFQSSIQNVKISEISAHFSPKKKCFLRKIKLFSLVQYVLSVFRQSVYPSSTEFWTELDECSTYFKTTLEYLHFWLGLDPLISYWEGSFTWMHLIWTLEWLVSEYFIVLHPLTSYSIELRFRNCGRWALTNRYISDAAGSTMRFRNK